MQCVIDDGSRHFLRVTETSTLALRWESVAIVWWERVRVFSHSSHIPHILNEPIFIDMIKWGRSQRRLTVCIDLLRGGCASRSIGRFYRFSLSLFLLLLFLFAYLLLLLCLFSFHFLIEFCTKKTSNSLTRYSPNRRYIKAGAREEPNNTARVRSNEKEERMLEQWISVWAKGIWREQDR